MGCDLRMVPITVARSLRAGPLLSTTRDRLQSSAPLFLNTCARSLGNSFERTFFDTNASKPISDSDSMEVSNHMYRYVFVAIRHTGRQSSACLCLGMSLVETGSCTEGCAFQGQRTGTAVCLLARRPKRSMARPRRSKLPLPGRVAGRRAAGRLIQLQLRDLPRPRAACLDSSGLLPLRPLPRVLGMVLFF